MTTWTAKDVEEWIVEAAETLHLLPPAHGPKAYGNSMPAPVREHWLSYGSEPSRYIRRAAPDAIDRMFKVWEWLASLPESDRRLLYGWAAAKATRGKSVGEFAQREGIKSRTLRFVISRLCQGIADRLNGDIIAFRPPREIDDLAEILVREKANRVARPRPEPTPTYFRDPSMVLVHDASPEAAALLEREIERMNRRARKHRTRRRG